jgi:hypothetical protein
MPTSSQPFIAIAHKRRPYAGGHSSRHPVQQCSNVILRHAPILPSTPFQFFVVDCSAKSLKCVDQAERISSQIFVDVFFNQDGAVRPIRSRQNAQSGQAWPEPVHFAVCKPATRRRQSYRSTVTAIAKAEALTLIGPPHCGLGPSLAATLRLKSHVNLRCSEQTYSSATLQSSPSRRSACSL